MLTTWIHDYLVLDVSGIKTYPLVHIIKGIKCCLKICTTQASLRIREKAELRARAQYLKR